ncbi:MAG: antibiotic biosynthesis monooxygenase family protein [Pseudomonadota bacterium]
MANDSGIGFCVLYRWDVVEGDEEQFLEAWRNVTADFSAFSGGLGSRIHRSEDDLWLAYTQWPSRAAWEGAELKTAEGREAMSIMSNAIAERLEPILVEPIADLLIPPPHAT